jgi:diaminopimelate decarboxylase
MKGIFPIDKFEKIKTPFYYYDTALLQRTLNEVKAEANKHENFIVHYAIKANANPKVLNIIQQSGLGCDCVSGGEIKVAIEAGFSPSKIVFAGVGKSDWEINLALDSNIFCFNVESIPELEVINQLATAKGKIARIAIRVNPNVGAHTHSNITTGLAENKFGIALESLDDVIKEAKGMSNIELIGLHFHIGSQITEMGDFEALCNRINELQNHFEESHITFKHINVGGGLGVSYEQPDNEPVPNFKEYFNTYAEHLNLRAGQTVHFELGRSIAAQCGSLITRTLYIKQGTNKQFAIVDAGMTDLIRPALYNAYHKIENISSNESAETYDVVGTYLRIKRCFCYSYQLEQKPPRRFNCHPFCWSVWRNHGKPV